MKGSLRAVVGEEKIDIILQSHTVVHELEVLLLSLYPHIRETRVMEPQTPSQARLRFVVNGELVQPNHPLSDSDVVRVYSPHDALAP